MGWCLDLIIDDIDKIFGNNLHDVTVPQSAGLPYVSINYEKPINKVLKRKIVELFPPEYYIYFYEGTLKSEPPTAKIAFPGLNVSSLDKKSKE